MYYSGITPTTEVPTVLSSGKRPVVRFKAVISALLEMIT